MSWGAIGAAAIGGVGAIAASRGQGGRDGPDPLSDRSLSQRGIAIRTQEAFPAILQARQRFDSDFLATNLRQQRSAFTADDGIREQIEGDIIPSIQRQRAELFGSDVEQLRGVTPGLFGAQDIASELQRQAQEELALGRQLSEEEIRESQQSARAATQARGRGAGPFGVAQEILNRDRFGTARQERRRAFAGGTAQLGVDVAQPFLGIQARNNALIGSPLQQLAFNAQFAQAATPNIPVFDPNVTSIAQQEFQVQSGRDTTSSTPGILGGLFSGLGSIIGGSIGSTGGGF